jgi:hypothetical protein
MTMDPTSIRWRDLQGNPIACTEKLKMLAESVSEFREIAADALADAVLMGCAEDDVRRILRSIVDDLESPYPAKS